MNNIYQIKNNYRPDIDALRGIAVLLVIFNHLKLSFTSAGFIGVDIFFVISGFLITSNVFKGTQNKVFSLKKFYLHRMRRILPALILVLFITTFFSYFLLLINDLKNYSQSLLAAVFSLSNIYFWKFINIGYFSTDASIQQLLHTWSLGIEEQFYLIWPPLLFILCRILSHKQILLVTFLLTLFSFCCYYFLKNHPLVVYYSPITRAFELLLGALLAINYEHIYLFKNRYLNHLLSVLGLLLIFYAACIFTEKDYPGFKILIPCLGTLLLIYIGQLNYTLGTKILTNRTLIFIGLISYSLYLWHWPIISYINYFKIPIDLKIGILISISLLMLSTLSYKFIEYPFRNEITFTFIKTVLAFFITPCVIAIIFYSLAQYTNNFGFNVISAEKLNQANTYYGLLKQEYGCIDNKEGFGVLPSEQLCTIGDFTANRKRVLVVGDSHATAAVGLLHVLLSDQHLQGYVVNQSGSPFILGNIANWRPNNPMDRNNLLKELINTNKYDYVVMGGFWNYYPDLPPLNGKSHPSFHVFKEGLVNSIEYIIKNKSIPVILLDNPPLLNISKTCGLSRITIADCSNQLSQIRKNQKVTRDIIFSLKKKYAQIILIDPTKVICDSAKCYSSIGGIPLYYDEGTNSHLNYEGSTLVGTLYLQNYGNPFNNHYNG